MRLARRIAPLLAAAFYVCGAGVSQTLTPAELAQGRRYLEQTRIGVVGATVGLSEAQWKFKPAPDRWSIGEIVEHMVLASDFMLGPVREQLAKAPKASVERDYRQVDSLVVNQFPNRLQKFQAPEMLQPSGRWSPAAALEHLEKNYTQLSEYLESTPDLRQHTIEALPLKAVSQGQFDSMDGYQWILATAAHIERHTKQILEVKAAANFPAK